MSRVQGAAKSAGSAGGAAVRGPLGPQDVIVLVHVPKAAGTSLAMMLEHNQTGRSVQLRNVFKGGGGVVDPPGDERIRAAIEPVGSVGLIYGHVPLGVADRLPAGWRPRYITCLRDPVDRAISHYFQILDAPRVHANGGSDSAPEAEVAPELATGGVVEDEDGFRPPVEPLRADMPYELALSDLRYVPDNLHTRMLCGEPAPFGEATEAMLERAMSNLERRVAVFGLVERFDESMVLFGRRLGYRGLIAPTRRANARRPRGEAIPADLLEAARRANRLDIELYDFATRLFDRAPERRTLEYQVDLAAFRQARADSSSSLEEQPPPPGFTGGDAGWSMVLRARVDALRSESELGAMRRRLIRWSELQQRAMALADEIAAQGASLDRIRTRRKGDDRVLDAPQRAELKIRASKVRARRRQLVSQQSELHAQLRMLGDLGSEASAVELAGSVDEVITRRHFAAFVGVPVTTVRRWESTGIVRPAWREFLGTPTLVFSEADVEFGRRLATHLRERPGQMTLARAVELARRPPADRGGGPNPS